MPSLHFLNEFTLLRKHRSKEAAFADSFIVAGTAGEIKAYWDVLQKPDPLNVYFLKSSKSCLMVRKRSHNNAVEMLQGREVKLTSEGRLNLGVVNFVPNVTSRWID